MSSPANDPNRERDPQDDAPTAWGEPPSRLRGAASGITEAQAWKGQQIAKGWRKLVDALRRRNEGEKS
jgi:hypothetical protein